jgi:hypothetical protein
MGAFRKRGYGGKCRYQFSDEIIDPHTNDELDVVLLLYRKLFFEIKNLEQSEVRG